MARVSPLIVAGSACAMLLIATVAKPTTVLVWNASPSVPIGLYVVERHRPSRGEIAALKLRGKASSMADARQYLPAKAVLLKPVVAIDGDTVCRYGAHVFVNGRLRAKALARDKLLRPMPSWTGCRKLHSGQVFVLSARKDSFDSRYFGPVDSGDVLGTAAPMFW
ncbi:MAG: S26 family signal peptidase [Parvibaculaceae bacterium]